MERILDLLAVLAVGLGIGPYNPHFNELTYEIAQHSVVLKIKGTQGDWLGAGSVIEIHGVPGILTAWHVTEAASIQDLDLEACWVVDLTDCIDLPFDAVITAASDSLAGDWSIHILKEVPIYWSSAQLRSRAAVVGEEVYRVGVPAGNPGLFSYGIVTGFADEGGDIILTDAFAFYGSSGGGLFDKRGRLLGITVAIMDWDGPIGEINYSVPITPVRALRNWPLSGYLQLDLSG